MGFAFDYFQILSDWWVDQLIDLPARPFDFDAVHLRRRTHAENLTRIVRREITAARGLETPDLLAAVFPRDDRADRAGITLRRDEIQTDPVVAIAAFVSQQHRRGAVVDDQHVEIAVVVVITDRQATRRPVFTERLSRDRADVFESSVDVLKEQQRFLVLNFQRLDLDHVVRMSVRENQIRIAVVVEVEEAQPPAAEQTRRWSNLARLVDECQVLLILIETEQLLIDVRDEQVLPTIAIDIRGIDSHSRARRTRVAVSDAREESDLFKLSVAFVHEEKIRERVVRHEEIHQAVVIHVSGDGAKGFSA